MDLGFETIGNACIIVHDRSPVLATDPWLSGPAYFGSWRLSHAVPKAQVEHVERCPYLWISHGHPDHLSLPSLERLRDKTILLPDHYGGRMARELQGLGFRVQTLPCGQWFPVSERVRVASLANYNQDATLVMDVDGHLVIDANDAGNRGSSRFLARERHRFHKRSVLACLTGYGDADMIHFFDEQGNAIPPAAATKTPCGPGIKAMLDYYDIDYFAPSSAMHRYNRTDSGWADEYATPVEAHAIGFDGGRRTLLPAFVRFDLHTGSHERIDPPANDEPLLPPSAFGDDWSAPLERGDVDRLRDYFRSVEHLHGWLGYLNFRVGGKDHFVDIDRRHPRGITFATPARSLMQAIEWQAFDDILIGNFCRTTLHGDWWGKQGAEALYPHFTPFVAKFGDNGGARTAAELRAYLAEYLRRGYTEFTADRTEQEMLQALQPYL